MEPRRRAQPQGCGGQSGEIPAQRISANQHSPTREACLLTRWGGRGLGAEARASEVRSQGEDWGWLCEHSLKGASVPQLAGRESGKRSGTVEEARGFFLPLCFGVHEVRGLRALPKGAQEMGTSCSYQRRHQRRACCCSHQEACVKAQVTIHTSPPRSLCSPPLPGSRDPGTTSLGERTARLRLVQHHAGLCRRRLAPHSVPLPPPRPE